MLLIDKYKPRRYEDLIGQDKALKKLHDFVADFKKFKQKSALVYGPSGIGKTISIKKLAEKLDLEIIELNASDFRNKEAIERIIGRAIMQRSLFNKSKLVLIDEVDGISGNEDRGGLVELMRLIELSCYPIVLTTNSIEVEKLEGLIKKSLLIEFEKVGQNIIFSFLKKICGKENISYSDESLLSLSKSCGGDLRAAIIDLETCIENKKLLPEQVKMLGDRLQHEETSKVLNTIFRIKDISKVMNSIDNSDIDLIDYSPYVGPVIFSNDNALFYWVEENIAKEYSGDSLFSAYNFLSKADVYHGRILNRQYWDFLVYIRHFLSSGISISNKIANSFLVKYTKTKRCPKNNFKLWPLVNSRKRNIAKKFASYTYISTRRAIKDMPYFKLIIKNNFLLAKDLKLTDEEFKWLNN